MYLGAIADDFTGATDLASILRREGMRVILSIGVPSQSLPIGDADAVVVALKSRTVSVAEAVAQSLEALEWLRARGTKQFFFKYCSTFDSTAEGNIGPVADALGTALDAKSVFVCPAFPANRRTVFNGYLFVGHELLQDSPMKDHPLTPMRRSNLVELMQEQSEKPVKLISMDVVRKGAAAIKTAISEHEAGHYFVVDAICDEDLIAIGQAAASHILVTGGSAAAMGLPANFGFARGRGQAGSVENSVAARTAILAGSCSAATRQQLERARALWPSLQVDVDAIAAGQDVAGQVLAWAQAQPQATPIVIYGSADPQEVEANQVRYGRERAGAMMEETLASIAAGLVAQGVNRLLVAGGETSGAIVSALNVEGLEIGAEIAPGVPWTSKLGEPSLQLALKSGNFGGPDFFERALQVAG